MSKFFQSLINDKQSTTFQMLKVPRGHNVTFSFDHNCTDKNYVRSFTAPEIENGKIYNLIVTELGAFMIPVNSKKPRKGTGEFSLSLAMALNDTNYGGNLALCKVDSDAKTLCNPSNPVSFNSFELISVIPYETNEAEPQHLAASEYNFEDIKPGKQVIC